MVMSNAPKTDEDRKEKSSPGRDNYPENPKTEKVLKLFPASLVTMVVGFVYIVAAVITLAFVG
jgi:hypothetical protein